MEYLNTSRGSTKSDVPANIRYRVHPRDQMSTLLVLGFDVSSVSGAM